MKMPIKIALRGHCFGSTARSEHPYRTRGINAAPPQPYWRNSGIPTRNQDSHWAETASLGLCLGCMGKIKKTQRICPACGMSLEFPPLYILGELEPGTLLYGARYLVGRCVGSGRNARVYLGFDRKNNERVAIKEYYYRDILHRDEIRMMEHSKGISGVASFQRYFSERDKQYLVENYIEGQTMKKAVGNEPMLKETCLNLLLPVMETLEELHSKGVAHCDINEYNLIIDRSDKVWLVDFSMATEVNTCMNPDRVRTVLPGFAFSYPPELSYPYNLPVGPWTDVYRMGIMIARLTGADLELLRLQNVFRRPFEAAFCAVLEKAMQLEPSERFQNIKDMRRAFQNCLAHTEE